MVKTGNNYLFDTSVFIDYFRQRPVARQIIFDTRNPQITAGYSIITEAELWAGINKFRTEASHILLLRPFNRYFINVTIARRAGQLKVLIEDSIKGKATATAPGLDDCLIAATAEYNNLTIVTRNTKHFNHFANHSINIEFYEI
jgi:tRNA(fMet)-specific endonuclease VapC